MDDIAKNYFFTANDICDQLGIKMPNLYYHLGRVAHSRYKFINMHRRHGRHKKRNVYYYDFATVYEISTHVYNDRARRFRELMLNQYKLATKIAYGKKKRMPIAFASEEDFKNQYLEQLFSNDIE